ncbi:MAG: glycosyltransferase, partial [Variovorax sp.]
VYLLDDGGTDQKRNSRDLAVSGAAHRRRAELTELCRQLGVHYRTRAANLRAKAGNLNSGLSGTSGDLVVVFDADHAPAREFLRETVGYFVDEARLFLVQTPHFFSNPDPLERNLGTFDRMPSENEMFYGTIQKGLDKWNAAFFCGSAAVLRRAALEEVGGFSGVSITEDCETALDLHSRGWKSLYVNRPMISGLQPDTFSSFIGQRSRWCRGMIQILLLKNPLLRKGLSLPQRICYLSSALFWFFPFMRMVFMAAPLLFILFNLKIYDASVEEFVAYTITYLVIGEILRNYLFGQVRWPWVSEVYEYVQSVYLFRAIISVLINPRRPTFTVTAKGETLQETRLSELAWPYFAIVGVLLFALGVTVYRYNTEPQVGGLLLVVGAWNVLNLFVAAAALGVVTERRERRTSPRLVCLRDAVDHQHGV